MKLDPNAEIFRQVPPQFESFFPSNDSLMNGKFQALMSSAEKVGGTVGDRLTTLHQAQSFNSALAICNKEKATEVGDLLTSWLPKVAWVEEGGVGGSVVQGLFAEVPWGSLSDLQDPKKLVEAMGRVGLNIAMTTMAAIPVYGQVASALVGAGRLLYRLFDAKAANNTKRLVLPWAAYSKSTDEDVVRVAHQTIFRGVDWMRLFMPPFDIAPWRVSAYEPEKYGLNPKGLILMPTKGGEPAWSSEYYGCMPGTFRVAGQLQQVPGNSPAGELKRYLMRPKGVTPRKVEIFYRETVTNCGDYLPAVAQLGAATWQQIQAAGNPDMYKIEVNTLESAWTDFFGNLWSTVNDQMRTAAKDLSWHDEYLMANLVGQMVEPYLCYQLDSNHPWEMGVPAGYRPHTFYHEKIFTQGPVPMNLRNSCLFVEESAPIKSPIWPYGSIPKASSVRGGVAQWGTSPAISGSQSIPKGYRCIPYPTQEMANARWSSPLEVFIKPQLDALRKRQWSCLNSTLVSAYVRPVAYQGLDAYAAFLGKPGEPLRTRCLALRELLLKSDLRYRVNLKDADAIDPKFADLLRKSGVNNSPSQMGPQSKARRLIDSESVVPPAPESGGGTAFQDLGLPPAPGSSVAAWVAAGLVTTAVIGGVVYYFATQSPASQLVAPRGHELIRHRRRG